MVSPKHHTRGLACKFRLREGMNVGLALEETVLVTEIGSGSTGHQVSTEPRDCGNFNMYQAWLSTVVRWMQVREVGAPMVQILGK